MIKLDKSKVYDLRDLSYKQLKEVLNFLKPNDNDWLDCDLEEVIMHRMSHLILYSFGNFRWVQDVWIEITNALILFDTNERIIQLQQEEQKLNNRLMEIADEMRELTYKD